MVKNEIKLDDKLHWYKDAVIYELHIKAFRDSNGDGIGDFAGLLQKLDYLQELGVTAIWLLPFYPSPLRDDGYDIADYYSIHTSYGNIGQFKQFLDEAHKRNLKVITELVINHTSDQHPWFQRARLAPRDSEERNYYVWTDDPNQYKDVRIIFQDFESSNWTWDPVAQQYYWHRFFHHQPDLNYDSPIVQEEIFRILDYWCAMGVDGFRLDAIPYLFEREGTNGENLPETHAFLKRLRKHVDEKFPGTVLLAEANMWPEDSASYFGSGDECHMNYHFPVMPRMFMSLQMEDQYPITDIFAQTPEIPETCQWAIFLRNHDELTLEMVTDEERDYMYKVYAKDPKARINLGIRHRLAPLMENNRRKIELMNSLLFALPGTPVIYYGDEIGMGDNFYLGDRDGVRTPMQWSPDRNAGFSDTNPQKLYLPVILDPEYHYETVNVETQRRNTSSLFWYMKSMISIRKKYKAFSRGSLRFINQDNPKVLAFTRTYQDETILVVVNFSKFSQAAEIDMEDYAGSTPMEVISRNQFPAIKEDTPYFFTLSPHSFYWFTLQAHKPELKDKGTLPSLVLNQWDEVLDKTHVELLEQNLLRAYLPETKWLSSGGRMIYSVRIQEAELLKFSNQAVAMLLLEVNYESRLPENYQLPIAFINTANAGKLISEFPQALIAECQVGNEPGWLCDAYFLPDFQQELFRQLLASRADTNSGQRLTFNAATSLQGVAKDDLPLKSKIHACSDALTCIAYNNQYLLKIYRKVDKVVNPDVEITRYLCDETDFNHTPCYLGAIEWKLEKDVIVLAMVETMIDYHGNGHGYMLERFNNYIERILAAKIHLEAPEVLTGSLTEPADFDQLPESLQTLLGARTAEEAKLIGKRVAQLHLALNGPRSAAFSPEPFSLHYQRSLFSSMLTLVREAFDNKERTLRRLPEDVRKQLESLPVNKEEVLESFRRIYAKKLDMLKIRIHGNLQLDKVLLTGTDIAVHDFLGNPATSFSERRLKRSALRDVAAMIRSIHNVAFEGLYQNNLIQKEEQQQFVPFATSWAHYVAGFFMKAYMEEVEGSGLLPSGKEDLKLAVHFYLLRKSLHDFNHALNNRPQSAIAPLRLIKSIIESEQPAKRETQPAF
jgi:maltose alpha-D-glucosyltransferase / alpha-amylase